MTHHLQNTPHTVITKLITCMHSNVMQSANQSTQAWASAPFSWKTQFTNVLTKIRVQKQYPQVSTLHTNDSPNIH